MYMSELIIVIVLYYFCNFQLGRFTGLKAAVVLGGDRQVFSIKYAD